MTEWMSGIGSLKIALVFLALFFIFFILASCTFPKRVVLYEHVPSKEFRENDDINESALQPFIDDGVLFIVRIKGYEKYDIWLGLYSKEKEKSVVIKKAILSNEENEDTYKESATFNTTLVLKGYTDREILVHRPSPKELLYKSASLGLFEVGNGSLGGVSGTAKTIFIKVFYEIDGKEGMMNYEIKRRFTIDLGMPTA